ncbi:MAG: hypothetical protein FJ100_06735 [Deltaproteobacteria bacterium]|nr:hypothetical protein [Deltaproteobacteria bacterium]
MADHPHDRAVWLAHRRWNTGMAVGVRQLGAYEPFAAWRTAVLQKALTLGSAAGPWPKMFAIWPGRSAPWSPLWDALAVRTVVADPSLAPQPGLRPSTGAGDDGTWTTAAPWPRAFAVSCAWPVADPVAALDEVMRSAGPALWVEGVSGLPACAAPAVGAVQWVRDDLSDVQLRAELPWPGWLVLMDLPYPGWHATVNGGAVEVAPANAVGRAVRVPAGRVEVAFTYRPASVAWGAVVSLVGLAVCALWMWRTRRGAEPAPGPWL